MLHNTAEMKRFILHTLIAAAAMLAVGTTGLWLNYKLSPEWHTARQ